MIATKSKLLFNENDLLQMVRDIFIRFTSDFPTKEDEILKKYVNAFPKSYPCLAKVNYVDPNWHTLIPTEITWKYYYYNDVLLWCNRMNETKNLMKYGDGENKKGIIEIDNLIL